MATEPVNTVLAGGNPASQGENHNDSQADLVDSRGNPRDTLRAHNRATVPSVAIHGRNLDNQS
jgi:hypothetical protein